MRPAGAEVAEPAARAALADDAGTTQRTAVAGQDVPAAGAMEAADGGEPSGDAPASTALVVRSTLGLALPRAFFVDLDGVERPIALEADGACRVPRAPPFEVRAAGHRETAVVTPGEVALEPVIGVVLRASDLRERVVSARLFWYPIETYPEHEGWAVAGFAGAGAFAAAVDPRGLGEPFLDELGWVPIDLATADLRLVMVKIRNRVEGTFEHALELDERVPATLAIAPGVRCPSGCEAPLERVLWALESGRHVSATPEPWGELYVQTGLGTLRPADDAELVTPGVEYGVGARCPACGAYERRFVVAEPGENRVDLALAEGGTVVLARVDRAAWSEVRLRWEPAWALGRPTGFRDYGWSRDGVFAVADDGLVRLVLPHAIPLYKDCAWPMPPAAKLTARAAGAEPAVVWTELPPGETIDVGRLPLAPGKPHAVLAAGHGAVVPRYGGFAAGEAIGIVDVKEYRPRPNGDLELFFERGLPWDPARPPERLLLCDNKERILGFELRDGRYVSVPETRRTLRVEARPEGLLGEAGQLMAGVRWQGVEVQFNLVLPAPRPGRPVEWTLGWPADAEALWWTPGYRRALPSERRSVPLRADALRLELR